MIVHLKCKPDDKSHRFVTKATLSSGWRVAKADWADSRTFSTKICARVDRTHPDLSVSIGRENEGKTSDWSAATWLAVGSRRVCCMNNRGKVVTLLWLIQVMNWKSPEKEHFHTQKLTGMVEVWRSGVDLHSLCPRARHSSSNTSRVRGSGYGNRY